MADPRVERERIAALVAAVDQLGPSGDGGSAARLVTTVAVSSYPTAAGVYYGCNPTEADGAEVEGGAASYTADTTQVMYVLNQGTAVPPVGTRVIASAVGGRWVFRYDG
jgi:hypothetical protein